jgi:uncharacterized protein
MLKSLFRFWSPIFLVIGGLSSTASFAAPNTSFPCSKRLSPDEKAICQDPRLTTLDRIANQGYLFLRAKLGKSQANKINLPLIRQRQKCKTDIVCIEKAQRESIRVFNQNGAKLEIPDLAPVQTVNREQPARAAQPETPPEPAPQQVPAISPEAVTALNNPAERSPEPAPVVERPATLPENPEPAQEAPAPADATAATVTPASPPSATTPDADTKATETAEAPQEPIDQPIDQQPVETDGKSAANDNEPSQENAQTVAEAAPEAKGPREWRPEMEKEIRAESELESSATDTLTREIAEAEQIKPLTRQERQALENTRSKHRTAFMLAAILFALVVAYAISKLKRDPGLSATAARPAAPRVDPQTTITKAASTPISPPPAPGPAPAIDIVAEPASKPVASARPTIGTSSVQSPPGAWVWTQYKGML